MNFYSGELKKGDKGEPVRKLQKRLIQIGFTDCLIDGKHKKLTADGAFGPITEACLANFQAKAVDASSDIYLSGKIKENYMIEADGVMDFPTWYVLHEYDNLSARLGKILKQEEIKEEVKEPGSFASMLIETASSQIGVKEEGGNNRGKKVNEFIKIGSCGDFPTGLPWCQYFMNWALKETCEKLKLEYKGLCSGYTPSWVNWGKKKGIAKVKPSLKDIIPGSFGYIYGRSRGNAIHVFLIEGTSKSGSVVTIEGNTNDSGGREGYKVARRYRPLRQVWCQLNIPKLYK